MSIIVEGPDGAGKTTLVQELQGHFPKMELHPRFCTSTEGPVVNLAEEVYKDAKATPTHWIYDRHPTLSEYIYASTIPGRKVSAAFLSDTMGRIRQRVARTSLVIFCLPPFSVVETNVHNALDDQMFGVATTIERIYEAYQMHYLMWPGMRIRFDYTNYERDWDSLIHMLSNTRGIFWREET